MSNTIPSQEAGRRLIVENISNENLTLFSGVLLRAGEALDIFTEDPSITDARALDDMENSVGSLYVETTINNRVRIIDFDPIAVQKPQVVYGFKNRVVFREPEEEEEGSTGLNLESGDTLSIYVNKDQGNDTADGLTASTAKKTLQAACNLLLGSYIRRNVVIRMDQDTPNDPWVRGDASIVFSPQTDNDTVIGSYFSHAVKIKGGETPIDSSFPSVTVAAGGVASHPTDPTLAVITLDEDITGSLATGQTYVSQEFDGDFISSVVDLDDTANTITVQDPTYFFFAGQSLRLFSTSTTLGANTRMVIGNVVLQGLTFEGLSCQITSPAPTLLQQASPRLNGVGSVGNTTQLDISNCRFEGFQWNDSGGRDQFFLGMGGGNVYTHPSGNGNWRLRLANFRDVSINGQVFLTIETGDSMVMSSNSVWYKNHDSTFFVLREGATMRDRGIITSSGCSRLARLYPGATWHADLAPSQPSNQIHTAEVFNLQKGAKAIDIYAKYNTSHTGGASSDVVMPDSGAASWNASGVLDNLSLALYD